MFRLVYSSDYTVYTVGTYHSIEDCERDCRKRYGASGLTFGHDDAGTLYAPLYADDGIVVLKLYEVGIAHAS
jgi:hypothetical protein